MSAGIFKDSKYETPNGSIVNVRVQPETEAAVFNGITNAPPAGAATIPGRFPLRLGSRRAKPFSGRSFTLAWTSTPPTGYKPTSVVRVPVLALATYNGADLQDTGTYLGAPVKIVGKNPHMGSM